MQLIDFEVLILGGLGDVFGEVGADAFEELVPVAEDEGEVLLEVRAEGIEKDHLVDEVTEVCNRT